MRDVEYYLHQPMLESSLSRVWQHLSNPDTQFAVVSAFLQEDDRTDEQNHKQLARDIRATGNGYIELLSGYTYQRRGSDVLAQEKSYLIPNIRKSEALSLARKYGQESILWKEGDTFGVMYSDTGRYDPKYMFKTDGSEGKNLSFNRSDIAQAFSSLRKGSRNQAKRKFAFVAESRIKDWPTAAIYWKGEYPRDEYFKIIEAKGTVILGLKDKLLKKSSTEIINDLTK